VNGLGVLLGGSWASGINLYLTVAALGLADRAGLIELPGDLGVLSHPLVITIAVILFVIEFVADKIPYVNSAWDSIHTVIRPAGAALMVFMGTSGSNEAVQLSLALLGGTVAMDSHLTKATARVAINTFPEPITNSIASISEDALVVVALWLAMKHPVIATLLVISFIVFSIWFLKVMFRFLKKIFSFLSKRTSAERSEDPGKSLPGGEAGKKTP